MKLTRREFLTSSAAASLVPLPSTAATPAFLGSASHDILSPTVLEFGGWVNFSVPSFVPTYGQQKDPTWFVSYAEDEGAFESLTAWVNADDKRELVAHDADVRRATVRASPADIGTTTLDRYLGNGLQAMGYVDRIDVNIAMDLIAPLELTATKETFSQPGRFDTFGRSFNTTGIAFETGRTTLGDARTVLGVDDVSISPSHEPVRVGVIDTGLNHSNGRVFGQGTEGDPLRVPAALNAITGEEADVVTDADGAVDTAASDFSPVADANGHGTWCAAAIAAHPTDESFRGIAADATVELYPAKALADDGSGSTVDIIDAVAWMREQGVDIISLSLGSWAFSESLANEGQRFLETGGSAVVCAVGNDRQMARWTASPGDVEHVLGVAATTNDPAEEAEVAYFSNVGPDDGVRDLSGGETKGAMPDISAPGMKVTALVPTVRSDDPPIEQTLSGTSMATPKVAGVLALALADDASLRGDHERLSELLAETAAPIPAAGETEVGAGHPDVPAFLSKTVAETTQTDVRTSSATARDRANEAMSGNALARWF